MNTNVRTLNELAFSQSSNAPFSMNYDGSVLLSQMAYVKPPLDYNRIQVR
jgi:hypothetical protein